MDGLHTQSSLLPSRLAVRGLQLIGLTVCQRKWPCAPFQPKCGHPKGGGSTEFDWNKDHLSSSVTFSRASFLADPAILKHDPGPLPGDFFGNLHSPLYLAPPKHKHSPAPHACPQNVLLHLSTCNTHTTAFPVSSCIKFGLIHLWNALCFI